MLVTLCALLSIVVAFIKERYEYGGTITNPGTECAKEMKTEKRLGLGTPFMVCLWFLTFCYHK